MNMQTAITNFQNYITVQKGFSPKTIQAYVTDLEKFTEFLTIRDYPSHIHQIQEEHIVSYLSYLTYPDDNKKPNLVTSRARKLASIRSFFNFLRKKHFIDVSPAVDIDIPKLPQKEPDYLTVTEYQHLLATISEVASPFFKLRDLCFFSLFLSTGIRVSELVNLTLSDIDLEYKKIKIHRKGNKEQTIPLSDEAVELVRAYLSNRPETQVSQLFISKKGNGVRANTKEVFLLR
jgi:site-specific recombinase XerD